MKTNNIRKLTAVILSGTMILGSTVTAFAANPTSDAGTGNILSYGVESVIVPTSIQIALNPQNYSVTTKAATTAADATYKKDATITTAALFAENKGYLYTRTQTAGVDTAEDPEDDEFTFTAVGASDEFDAEIQRSIGG